MNILIVFAHPEQKSFDGQMKEKAVSVFTGDGHVVQISDLYSMRFKPTADSGDFIDPANAAFFDLHAEQIRASQLHTFTPDILQEQRKIMWADMIILQFPLWWYSVPAILKGWFDRVLAYGFAYGQGRSLAGRKVMLVLTTGGQPRDFTQEKRIAVNAMLDHIQRGILHFCGFEVLPPFAVYGAASATTEQHEQVLLQYTQLLRSIDLISAIDYGRS